MSRFEKIMQRSSRRFGVGLAALLLVSDLVHVEMHHAAQADEHEGHFGAELEQPCPLADNPIADARSAPTSERSPTNSSQVLSKAAVTGRSHQLLALRIHAPPTA